MAKVLQRLVRRGLLVSQQGTRGGYQLARVPAQISVADVIQAIEGPVTVTACSTDEGPCEQFSKCNVRDPLYRVRERILAALGECTIAELAADPPSPAPAHRRGAAHAFVKAAYGGGPFRPAERDNDGDKASDLHGLSRDDAGGPARRRGDAAVLHGALRQRRQPQPSVRLGGGRGGREGAQADRGSHRRQRQGDRLHQRRDRVGQPGDQGRRRDVSREGQPHHHRGHRAQGGARHVQAPREGRLPRHVSAGAEGRPHQPRRR